MNEFFAATHARLVNERAQLRHQVEVLDEQATVFVRQRDKLSAEADGISRAIDLMEQSAPAEEAASAPRRLNIAEAIMADLAEAQCWRTLHAICGALGRKPSQVLPALARLLAAGRIHRRHDGAYCVPAVAAAAE